MFRQTKMVALKPFPFHGELLKVDDELQPDNQEQGKLLETIGLASYKKRSYRTRVIQPNRTPVMTAEPPASAPTNLEPEA